MTQEFPIAVGLGCEVACEYCPQSAFVPAYKALGGPTLMTPDLLAKYLRTVPRDSVLVWSGFSDPFLNPHLPEMIRRCHANGWAMRLDTTLAGCSDEGAELVALIPWRMLKIHLPSHGDKMKVPVTPEYLLRLKRVAQNPCLKCFVYFGFPYPQIQSITDAAMEPVEYFTTLHTRAGNLSTRKKMDRRAGPMRSDCHWLRRGHLLPNGKLCLCCEDWSLLHVIGDLNTQTYDEVFQSAAFSEVLAAHDDDTKPLLCRTCEHPWWPEGVS